MESTFKHFIISLAFLFLTGCSKEPPKPEKPLVLVSIPPYEYFLKKIAGDDLIVKSIVPQGVNSHTFEPSPKNIHFWKYADIWFEIGDPFEKNLSTAIKEKNPDLFTFDLRTTVDLIPYKEDTYFLGDKFHSEDSDIHVWLSPPLVITQSKAITKILSDHFPEHKETFEKNFADFKKEIDELDFQIRNILRLAQHRSFLTSHPSFGYFCWEYGLEQISVEMHGKDPLPKFVDQIVKVVKAKDVRLAITQPQFNNKGTKLIASKVGAYVRIVDPYSEDYKKTMLYLAKVIANPKNP